MKRAKKAGTPAPRPARPMLAVLLTLGVVAALLFGLSRLGDEARRRLGPRDRYAVPFADIRCPAPPGLTRDTFLTEVRYAAGAAPTFQALAPDAKARLAATFAAHPWVASVDAVTVEPPDVVRVALTFRTPALAVQARVVDAKGILLPAAAPTAGVPLLLSPVAPPGAAGAPWPDGTVTRAAPVAAEYKPRTIERTAQGWELVMPDGQKLIVSR